MNLQLIGDTVWFVGHTNSKMYQICQIRAVAETTVIGESQTPSESSASWPLDVLARLVFQVNAPYS